MNAWCVSGITDFSELSFADDFPGAKTDLEGLSAFDSNNDGRLDANDERFDEFRIWRDQDQDGEADPGELQTLAYWGLESLDPVSRGLA